MFPIRDTVRSRSFPLVNWIIIILNALVFFLELELSPEQLTTFIATFGLVPASLDVTQPLTLLPFLTHMFLHGGWFHIISNMWVLFIFGDNVEDRMGSWRYLLFYLLGGLVAGGLQVFFSPGSQVPSVGASGAIAAVMGAYFLFYPKARVITLIPIFIIPWFVEIPAILYLGFWFISQLFNGFLSLSNTAGTQMGGVAWWAHVGGFAFGLATARLLATRKPEPRWHPDEYYPW
jgi:membrane associated rhomboid family serine protease